MRATAIITDENETGVYMNIDVLVRFLRETQNGAYSTKDYEREYVCIEHIVSALSRIKQETYDSANVITDTNE